MALGATPEGGGPGGGGGYPGQDYGAARDSSAILTRPLGTNAPDPMDITQPVASLAQLAQLGAGGHRNDGGAIFPLPVRSDGGGSMQPMRSDGGSSMMLPMRSNQGPPWTPPFNPDACGANVEISADGYTASRTRGCRQAAAIGNSPLELQAYGRYFEVTVEETVTGWVGGLGIGVTATPPREIQRLPDKAWKMPATFIVGYWGCIFADGAENPTSWRPDTLGPGARVGLLVADSSCEVLVFVDGRPVVRVENVKLACKDALYPVVDVFSAAKTVTLRQHAVAPPPPYTLDLAPGPRSASGSIAESSLVGGGGGSLAGSMAGVGSFSGHLGFGLHGLRH